MTHTPPALANTVPGPHRCKAHEYAHAYRQHVACGHEFCSLYWKHCPRCHGSDDVNMVDPAQAHADVAALFARIGGVR